MGFLADEIRISQNFGRGADHVAAGGRAAKDGGAAVEVKQYRAATDEVLPLFTIYVSPDWIQRVGREKIIEILEKKLKAPNAILNFEGFPS